MPSQNHSERDPVYCTKRMIGDERIAFCLVGNILQTFDNDLDIKIVKTVYRIQLLYILSQESRL